MVESHSLSQKKDLCTLYFKLNLNIYKKFIVYFVGCFI
jgi:hypothetical protein